MHAWVVAVCCIISTHSEAAAERGSIAVISHQAETAGIDGRYWDRTFPDARTVDAVHRSVLIRFPGTAQQIKSRLDSGLGILKAEVVLDYEGYETRPQGYTVRHGLGEEKWQANPPRWHIVGWALKRPWLSHSARGPTFNAYSNSTAYWAKYGAQDIERDRYQTRFGPAELSHARVEARLDVTQAFTDQVQSIDLGARLRGIEENGFLLKKLESYDARYRDYSDPYEWAVPTGGHGVRFKNPRLVVTFTARGKSVPLGSPLRLPPQTDLLSLGEQLKASGREGRPTAVMPSREELTKLTQQLSRRQRAADSAWRLRRQAELSHIGGDTVTQWLTALARGDRQQFEKLIQDILAIPPRYWRGWEIQDDLLVWHLFRDALPAYVQDHIKNYWSSWLMPEIPTSDLFHPQSREAADYWERTKDWRGRASFFRHGYNYRASTQNFNHTAAMGALLGGSIIGSHHAIADGRHGLEHFPLRLWTMRDGSSQELLDHYYLSITVSAQKMLADFGPSQLDRLMGRIMLDRSLELLTAAYHPELRRLISASGRARLSGLLVEQDGIYSVLHTLSEKGTLKYLDQPFDATVHGMPVWGYDFPPGRVAMQSIHEKWAPDWTTNVIDNKYFPFEETSTDTIRGAFDPPLWRRSYLGRHYGLASQDIKGGTADVIAQWNHKAEPSRIMEDLGTLTLRYAINDPDLATTSGGTMPLAGGMLTFQHKNRAIVCTKPPTEKRSVIALAKKDGLKSLATVIALWNFRPKPGWELYADGRLITHFPARLKAQQLITIKDGVTYIGIFPLPATDLGRTDEIVIGFGGGGRSEPNGAPIKPALTITSYNFQNPVAAAFDTLNWQRINTATVGGFVIELGDVVEYGDFYAFSKRMEGNRLKTRWEPLRNLLHIQYRSGQDLMEMGCGTDYEQPDMHFPVMPGQQSHAIRYRRINGEWPYLQPRIERDTSLAQQGTSGRLEKNGAVLLTQPGRKAYMQTEPISGTYTGYNPLPDPTDWSFAVPGGVMIKADGKVSLLRVSVQPARNRLWIDYAVKDGQCGRDMAAYLLVRGLQQPIHVERNGKELSGPLKTVHDSRSNYKPTYAIPIADERCQRAQAGS